jgi:GT2 family glycosyltransferase
VRRFVVATSGAGVTTRELRRTANSLVASSARPRNWIVVDSSVAQEKVTRMRSLRTAAIVVSRDELPIPEDAWVVFLRAGDALAGDALETINAFLDAHPECEFLYGDSHHGKASQFDEPSEVMRPGWSPERLRSHCYIGSLLCVRADVVARCGGVASLARSHEHDRALRLSEVARGHERLAHLLYYSDQAHLMPTASLDAVREHCARTSVTADVTIDRSVDVVRVRRIPSTPRAISVIVPTRGTTETIRGRETVLAAHAIETLIARSTFQNFDVVVVFDADTPTAAREAIIAAGHGRITPVEYDAEFNFADKVNRGVLASTGEYVLLLNDDTEIITPDALDTLVGLLEDPGVAMAGPLLLYEDGKIQSAGHVLNPIPYDLYRHRSPDHVGAQNLLRVQREVSGVIAACALIRRSVFMDVGGMCTKFPSNYNDVDFALKVQSLGHRVVWTPHARFYHFESQTRSPLLRSFEVETIGARWRDKLDDDPYFNPRLERYVSVWKRNSIGQRSLLDALGPTAPIISK